MTFSTTSSKNNTKSEVRALVDGHRQPSGVIKTDDLYKDMESNKDPYDTSDYPTHHPLHSNANKKVFGKMKDECAGMPIAECVCLRPKM